MFICWIGSLFIFFPMSGSSVCLPFDVFVHSDGKLRVETMPVVMASWHLSGHLKMLFWMAALGDPNEWHHSKRAEIPKEQSLSLEEEYWMTSLCFQKTTPSFRKHCSFLQKPLLLCPRAHFPKGAFLGFTEEGKLEVKEPLFRCFFLRLRCPIYIQMARI